MMDKLLIKPSRNNSILIFSTSIALLLSPTDPHEKKIK